MTLFLEILACALFTAPMWAYWFTKKNKLPYKIVRNRIIISLIGPVLGMLIFLLL